MRWQQWKGWNEMDQKSLDFPEQLPHVENHRLDRQQILLNMLRRRGNPGAPRDEVTAEHIRLCKRFGLGKPLAEG